MADQPMSQDEIDALLAGMGSASPNGPGTSDGPGVSGPHKPLDQSELDAILKDLDLDSNIRMSTPTAPVTPGGTRAGSVASPVPAAPTTPPGTRTKVAAANVAPATPAPAPPPAEPAGDQALGQTDIDALLASLEANSAAPAATPPAPPAPAAAAPPADPGSPLGQTDIDALLASLAAGDGATAADPAKPETRAMAAPAPPPPAAGAAETPGGRLDQGGIDALLAQLGAQEVSVGAERVAIPEFGGGSTSRTGTNGPPTLSLSKEDLSALVTKHQNHESDAGDAMIAQSDIDALVQQLAKATGEVVNPDSDPGAAAPSPSELAKHDDAIDKILAAAAPPPAAATMDAVDVKAELGKSPTSGRIPTPSPGLSGANRAFSGSRQPAGPPIAAVSPVELRITRFLLVAAVLLLAISSGALVVLTGAVKNLASELHGERTAALATGDSYSDDFKAAADRLASPDAEEIAKGVLFLERLKKRYPSNEGEIAQVLARHFRGHGAWKEAARQYLFLVEEAAEPPQDPRIWLEYAEALRHLRNRSAAVRQVYALLARESSFTGEHDHKGRARSESELAEHRRAIAEAHLLLGSLLAEPAGELVASMDPGERHAPGHGAASAAHAAGGSTDAPAAHDAHH